MSMAADSTGPPRRASRQDGPGLVFWGWVGATSIMAGIGANIATQAILANPRDLAPAFHFAASRAPDGRPSGPTAPPAPPSAKTTPSAPATPSAVRTVRLTGTLSPWGLAQFPGWLGGTDRQGRYHWIPVTVDIDTGAEWSAVDGQVLARSGIMPDGQTTVIAGFGGTETVQQFAGLTLVPAADPTAPLIDNAPMWSGIEGTVMATYEQVNLGQDVLSTPGTVFTVSGTTWTLQYRPHATLTGGAPRGGPS